MQADAPPHFCNSPHGLKPRRGGLFIATNPRKLFFLFFGGAARCSFPDVARGWLLTSCSQFSLQRPRRRKTKRKRTIARYPINRPPLRGLGTKRTRANL